MTIRLVALLLAVLCVSPVVQAQTASSFDAVRPVMQAFVDKGEIAGVVTLVATRDKVLHLAAAGSSDLAASRRMKTDDIFWVASMSKPITAVAVAILVDGGKVSFDDPILRRWRPTQSCYLAHSATAARTARRAGPILRRD